MKPDWCTQEDWDKLDPHLQVAILCFDFRCMNDDDIEFDERGNVLWTADNSWTNTTP